MTTATLHTSQGDIIIELFDNHVPKTVKNFTDLAKKDFYADLPMAPMKRQMQMTVISIHSVPGKVRLANSPRLANASP